MQHSTIDKTESTAASKPIPSTERIFQAVRECRKGYSDTPRVLVTMEEIACVTP